ncbi:hypothetical protein GCM10017562_59940 [Streptomyces roseofulvus]|uniref:hypothetical protein n=1 Tax=Streptomyces roseofulvus TaxID=33902 RepID=UPI0031FD7015
MKTTTPRLRRPVLAVTLAVVALWLLATGLFPLLASPVAWFVSGVHTVAGIVPTAWYALGAVALGAWYQHRYPPARTA